MQSELGSTFSPETHGFVPKQYPEKNRIYDYIRLENITPGDYQKALKSLSCEEYQGQFPSQNQTIVEHFLQTNTPAGEPVMYPVKYVNYLIETRQLRPALNIVLNSQLDLSSQDKRNRPYQLVDYLDDIALKALWISQCYSTSEFDDTYVAITQHYGRIYSQVVNLPNFLTMARSSYYFLAEIISLTPHPHDTYIHFLKTILTTDDPDRLCNAANLRDCLLDTYCLDEAGQQVIHQVFDELTAKFSSFSTSS